MRRLTYDALLAHITIVGIFVLLYTTAASSANVPFTIFLLLAAYLAATVMAPLVAWFFVRRMEKGELRARVNRLAMAYTKSVAWLSIGFGFWLMCLFFVGRLIER